MGQRGGSGRSGSERTIIEEIESRRNALTVDDLAELLSFSPRAIYDMVKQRRIPVMRFGASIRFDPKITADWIRERSQ
jgi:excisionase family DNA binding protein